MVCEKVVPDGGWGWLIVAGTALINIFNQSLVSIFGLVLGPKLEEIAGTTGVTTVMSINSTVCNLSGLVLNILMKKLSIRQITQIGVLCVSAGLAISSVTYNYAYIIGAYGVVAGLGLGLIATANFIIVNDYFDKRKSHAVGLSMAGTSFGQMVMPPFAALLISAFDHDTTIGILSGLSLIGILGSLFFDPVTKHLVLREALPEAASIIRQIKVRFGLHKNKEIRVDDNGRYGGRSIVVDDQNEDNVSNRSSLVSHNGTESGNVSDNENKTNGMVRKSRFNNTNEFNSSYRETPNEMESDDSTSTSNTLAENNGGLGSKCCCKKLYDLFNLKILRDLIFVHIMIGLSLAYTTSISFSTFFPLFLTRDLRMPVVKSSTCMTTLSTLDFAGRLSIPLLTSYLKLSHRVVFISGSFFLAISRSLLVTQTSYEWILFYSGLVGLARAATVINQNLVIAEYSKGSEIPSAVGINMACKALAVLTIGRILGVYKDAVAKTYAGCIHLLDIISFTVVVTWSSEVGIRKLKETSRALDDAEARADLAENTEEQLLSDSSAKL